MKAICFYFQIHQPFRLKRYRFFDIGNDHYYYDDFANDDIITRIAHRSYIPAAEALLRMIENTGGKFRCALSITGTALEQCEQYVPEFIDLLKKLADTGNVEFLAETYAHSLSSLIDPEEFAAQVRAHDEKINELFGQKPKVFRNTELVYCDEMAPMIYDMGYKGCITEGAKHILGWKSPNYVYSAASCPKLKLLLKNDKLSDDITFRFSNPEWDAYPLTADKYMDWIASTPAEEQVINLFMNLETFGEMQPRESGIFQFLEALPRFAAERGIDFWTPSEVVSKFKAVDSLSVLHPISWADEARDTSAWLGNKLQNEAFNKLYSVAERVRLCSDRRLKQDWQYLQGSDHFFYMSTKHMNDGAVHAMFSPYETPFQAFTNYMNVLADFIVRVEEQYPLSIENEELNSLLTTIRNQATEIEVLNKEVASMRNNLEHLNEEHATRQAVAEGKQAEKPAKKACKTAKKTAATKKPAAKKTTASKTKDK
ncbi:MAG TPA: glycoside hydrolase family 57 protein [Muribaculum sp.]|jgi:alpha-amylase|uniref:Glycoside hydrolase family 57 protein n=1 Tax=Heminiphilus faecis TaxID=2601703 RepID=A0ABV4D2C4_9BACT|nr:glycoside hydrolase family 57 protein [Heminiphilus faecis]RLT75724.1 alpha-amylase [bacterium J10(2018)]HRF69319.1 glycoside hydrolase family 57 protein [Muribaculum sp.]